MAGEHETLRENIEYIKVHTLKETAEYLGIKLSTVRSFVGALEIPHVRSRFPEPDYAMEVLEYARKNNVKKATEKYNVTRNQIHHWAKRHGVSVRNTERTKFFHSIPIQQVVDEVNETSLRDVAKKYGVTYQRVHQIVTRAGYKYMFVKATGEGLDGQL